MAIITIKSTDEELADLCMGEIKDERLKPILQKPVSFGILFDDARRYGFPEIYSFFIQQLSRSNEIDNHNLNRVSKLLAGKLFEYIAQRYISAEHGHLVLNPKRSLEFLAILNPSSKRIKDPFGYDSLQGITVPDGIIVDLSGGKPIIIGICDYTAIVQGSALAAKAINLKEAVYDLGAYGKGVKHHLVTLEKTEEIPLSNGTIVNPTPIRSITFRRLVDQLYFEYLKDDSTRISDFVERLKEERRRHSFLGFSSYRTSPHPQAVQN